jgi:flavin reductase (DIM6/NTAB) family NADH-FMN oxidoreductase RutF
VPVTSLVRNLVSAPELEATDYRAAMRQLAGGVALITAGRDQDISGMTVTSLTSLSAEPPRLMVAINRSASSFPLISRYGFFGVSIVGAGQQSVAERFSSPTIKGAARFDGAEWETRQSGSPLLCGALAAIDCQVEEIISRHSHAIIIGRPLATILSATEPSLAYWQGDYLALAGKEDRLLASAPSVPWKP